MCMRGGRDWEESGIATPTSTPPRLVLSGSVYSKQKLCSFCVYLLSQVPCLMGVFHEIIHLYFFRDSNPWSQGFRHIAPSLFYFISINTWWMCSSFNVFTQLFIYEQPENCEVFCSDSAVWITPRSFLKIRTLSAKSKSNSKIFLPIFQVNRWVQIMTKNQAQKSLDKLPIRNWV